MIKQFKKSKTFYYLLLFLIIFGNKAHVRADYTAGNSAVIDISGMSGVYSNYSGGSSDENKSSKGSRASSGGTSVHISKEERAVGQAKNNVWEKIKTIPLSIKQKKVGGNGSHVVYAGTGKLSNNNINSIVDAMKAFNSKATGKYSSYNDNDMPKSDLGSEKLSKNQMNEFNNLLSQSNDFKTTTNPSLNLSSAWNNNYFKGFNPPTINMSANNNFNSNYPKSGFSFYNPYSSSGNSSNGNSGNNGNNVYYGNNGNNSYGINPNLGINFTNDWGDIGNISFDPNAVYNDGDSVDKNTKDFSRYSNTYLNQLLSQYDKNTSDMFKKMMNTGNNKNQIQIGKSNKNLFNTPDWTKGPLGKLQMPSNYGKLAFNNGLLSLNNAGGTLGAKYRVGDYQRYATDFVNFGILDTPIWSDRYRTLQNYAKSPLATALRDYDDVAYLTDYAISGKNASYYKISDYQSAQRRWKLTDESGNIVQQGSGTKMLATIRFNKKGRYTFEAEQVAKITTGVAVNYYIREYLVLIPTNTMLYFKEQEKGPIILNERSRYDWVSVTKKTFNVNALGNKEIKTGVERIE